MTRTLKLSLLVALVAPAVVLAVWFLSPEPLAAPSGACTKVGTAGADSISGTGGGDFICARGGDDYVHAQGGNDTVLGEGGQDTLVGGNGKDTVRGGDQDDQLFVTDQIAGNDTIDGGGGFDRCYLDNRDTARNCEAITRGATVEAFTALDAELYGLVVLAETFQARTVEEPPQCTPPPETDPESC